MSQFYLTVFSLGSKHFFYLSLEVSTDLINLGTLLAWCLTLDIEYQTQYGVEEYPQEVLLTFDKKLFSYLFDARISEIYSKIGQPFQPISQFSKINHEILILSNFLNPLYKSDMKKIIVKMSIRLLQYNSLLPCT